MKIDRGKIQKLPYSLPPESKLLIQQLTVCSTDDELMAILLSVKTWTYGLSDMYHWVDVLDKFDSIFEDGCKPVAEGDGAVTFPWSPIKIDLPESSQKKKLILEILRFKGIMIENLYCSTIYSSQDHLYTLLASTDLEVVGAVMSFLSLCLDESNSSIFLNVPLQVRICELAASWGGKDGGVALAQCCQNVPLSSFPKLVTQLNFECPADKTVSFKLNTPERIVIQVPDAHLDSRPLAQVMLQLVEQYQVPARCQFRLFSKIRTIRNFVTFESRMRCILVRTYAMGIIILQKSPKFCVLENPPQELVDVVVTLTDDSELVREIKVAALRTMTAIASVESHEAAQNALLAATKINFSLSPFPMFAEREIFKLIASERDPDIFQQVLLGFLYEFGASKIGYESAIMGQSGLMECLLQLVKWEGPTVEHLTVITRAVSILANIVSMEQGPFDRYNGLSIIARRLKREIDACRLILPYVIEVDRQSGAVKASGEVDNPELRCLPGRRFLLQWGLYLLKDAIQRPLLSDSMRQLMGGLDLPNALKHIISNGLYYGSPIFSSALSLIVSFTNENPGYVSALLDNGFFHATLHALLEKPFPRTKRALEQLPQIFNVFCLNQRGMQAFLAKKPFQLLFKIFTSAKYLLEQRKYRGETFGEGVEALGRTMAPFIKHYTNLRADILKEMITVLEELHRLGRDSKYVCSTIPTGSELLQENDFDDHTLTSELIIDHDYLRSLINSTSASNQSQSKHKVIRIPLHEYIFLTTKFLDTLISMSKCVSLCREFQNANGLSLFLDLLNLPNLPALGFSSSSGFCSFLRLYETIQNLTQDSVVMQMCLMKLLGAIERFEHDISGVKAVSPIHGSILLHDLVLCLGNCSSFNLPTLVPPSVRHLTVVTNYLDLLQYCHFRNTSKVFIDQWTTPLGLEVIGKLSGLLQNLLVEKSLLQNLDDYYSTESKVNCESIQGQLASVFKFVNMLAESTGNAGAKVMASKLLCQTIKAIAYFHGKFEALLHRLIWFSTKYKNSPAPLEVLAKATVDLVIQTLNVHLAEPLNTIEHRCRLYSYQMSLINTVLFDRKRDHIVYHIMLHYFEERKSFRQFIDMFLEIHKRVDFENVSKFPVEVTTFLSSWLMILERLVNPKNVLESQHIIVLSQRDIVKFQPEKCLIAFHAQVYDSLMLIFRLKLVTMLGRDEVVAFLKTVMHLLKFHHECTRNYTEVQSSRIIEVPAEPQEGREGKDETVHLTDRVRPAVRLHSRQLDLLAIEAQRAILPILDHFPTLVPECYQLLDVIANCNKRIGVAGFVNDLARDISRRASTMANSRQFIGFVICKIYRNRQYARVFAALLVVKRQWTIPIRESRIWIVGCGHILRTCLYSFNFLPFVPCLPSASGTQTMVLSTLITTIINSFLSPFVDELTAEQLNIFTWSGQVSLTNVSIKPNAFDQLKLPFRIVHGHIGRIYASVPWRNIYAEPIVIKVSDVYAVALPNSEMSYNEEDEKNFEWAVKKSYLENIEYMKQKIKEQGKKEVDGFFVKLLVAATKNIQIFVNNVHVVYEDSSTNAKNGCFQVGANFSKLVFETELDRKSTTINDNIIHKLVKLEGLAVYMNVDSQTKKVRRLSVLKGSQIDEILKSQISTNGQSIADLQYILHPINFDAGATIHRKPEADSYKLPIVDLTMNLGSFHLQLTSHQIRALFLLFEVIDRANVAAPYRKWRPTVSIKEKPFAWWKFLLTALRETGIRRRKREFSWRSIESICKKRQTYTELYKRKLLEESIDEKALETLERELRLTSIVYGRSKAEIETRKLLEWSQKVRGHAGPGWFAEWWGWFSSSKDATISEKLKAIKERFIGEEKHKLYKAIDYDENTLLQLYPLEYVATRIEFNITMFTVTIKNVTSNSLKIIFGKQHSTLLLRPSSNSVFLSCQLDSLSMLGKNEVVLLTGKEIDRQFLMLTFEMNPLDKQSDFTVNLNMKSSYLLYDIATINELDQMVKNAWEENALDTMQSYAQYRLSDLKHMTSLGIELAIQKHKQLNMNIEVEPSFIIVPKMADISTADLVVLISLGKFVLTTKLLPKSNIRKVRKMMAAHKDRKKVMEEIGKLVYEKYICHVSNVQLMLSDAAHWREDLGMLDTDRHLLCPFEVKLNIGRSIVPQDAHFAKIMLTGDISQIEMKASESQINQILCLFINLPYGPVETTSHPIPTFENVKHVGILNNEDDDIADAYLFATKAAQNLETIGSSTLLALPSGEESGFNVELITKSEEAIPQQDLTIEFNLKNLFLSVFAGSRRPECALARFQLIKLTVNVELLADTKILVNCNVDDLRMDDIRTIRKETGIRTILAKSQKSEKEAKSIVTVYVVQMATERAIAVKISGMTYSFALDYMLSCIDAAMKAFIFPVEPPPASKVTTNQSTPRGTPRDSIQSEPFPGSLASVPPVIEEIASVVAIDMEKLEVIMLESLEVPDAVACIFNCFAKVHVKVDVQEIVINGNVSNIHMGVANYLMYLENGKLEEYVMSPTDMEINGLIKGLKQNIDLTCSDILISISPQMVNVVLGIMTYLGSATKPPVRDFTQGNLTDQLLTARSTEGSTSWYLIPSEPTTKQVDPPVEPTEEARGVDTNSNEEKRSQVIKFHMPVIKIFIKSCALNSLRFSLTYDANLVDNAKLTFNSTLTADYFNTGLLAWEPLIELVNEKALPVNGIIDLYETSTKVYLQTEDTMEILFTKSSISALNVIGSAFSSALTYQRGALTKMQENRVIIRNTLGIAILVDMNQSTITPDKASKSLTPNDSSKVINSGEECHFITENMAKVELLVSLQFSESIVIQRKIICSDSSVRCYFTSICTFPENEPWRWIVQVHDNGSTKEVDFRSTTQLVNHFDTAFAVYAFNGQKSEFVGKVGPLARFNLPLSLIHRDILLYIRPSEEFQLSDAPVDWRTLDLSPEVDNESVLGGLFSRKEPPKETLRYLVLSCVHKVDQNKHFFVKIRGEKVNVLFEDTDRLDFDESHIYNIKLIPFVRLKNLLPYSIEYYYEPVTTEVVLLEPGQERIIFYASFGLSKITYKVLNYLGRDWQCTILLPETGRENESQYFTFTSTEGGHSLCLGVNFFVENNSLSLSLFAPFWMVNQTNENITYRIDDEHVFEHPKSRAMAPFLLAFDPSKVKEKDKLSLAIDKSTFTKFFPLNVVPYSGSFLAKSPSGSSSTKHILFVNVHVELARIGLSKIITISSFYNVFNISRIRVEYSEDGLEWERIGSESSKAFFPKKASGQTLCFRFLGSIVQSNFICIRTSSQTLLPIEDFYLFVEVNVTEIEAKIKIGDYFYGAAPVLIANNLPVDVFYGQKGVTDLTSGEKVFCLPAKHRVFFCWLQPGPDQIRELVFQVGDEKGEVNLDFDKHVKKREDSTWGYVTFFDEKQRILLFTDVQNHAEDLLNTRELSQPTVTVEICLKGLGVNLVNNEQKKDLLYLTISSTCEWEERPIKGNSLKAKPLSIKENALLEELYQEMKKAKEKSKNEKGSIEMTNSRVKSSLRGKEYEVDFTEGNMQLISPRNMKLQRHSNRGLWFLYSSSAHIVQYHAKINRIQVDNQLSDHVFDVVFSPVIVPKSISERFELQQMSLIEFSAIIQSLGSVTRFKQLEVLIQEFMIQVDWGWISQILSLFDIETKQEDSLAIMIAKDLEAMSKNHTLSEMQKFVMRKSYFDKLRFGPLKAHISASVGDLPGGKFPLGLDFIIRFTGLTLGEINDILFKLDCFKRELVSMSDAELMRQIIEHYKTQVYAQLYKLILGLDIIGNPMKLALGIKKGIGDFFYEPAVGIIHGPEEFAEGIATGVKSLASNVLGGTAGALGRIGYRLGTGVAALTIDEKFQKERRERLNRKVSFWESGMNLFRGFAQGITGVVTKPYEGAREEGVEGLFKGVGQGVVGIVVHPATGVIDFASGSLHAFNEVIDPKHVARPVRPPRHFPSTRELSHYQLSAALGNQLVRNLSAVKYANEEYIYHLQLTSRSYIVLLSKLRLFFLKKSLFTSSWEPEWVERWTNCQEVLLEDNRLRILVKESDSIFCFADQNEHSIFDTNKDNLSALHASISNHMKQFQ